MLLRFPVLLALVLSLPSSPVRAQGQATSPASAGPAARAAGAAGARVKHTVPSGGQSLTVWEKRAAHPTRAIVLLHGRTWSSVPDFDLQVAGEQRSLMDALVAKGYAVYALDLRGYGSTPRDRSGWNTPKVAADDLGATLAWVAANSGIPGKPVLFGWSNGATVAQLCAQKYPDRLSDLILFGYWKDPDIEIVPPPDTVKPLRERTTADAAASDFIAPNAISRKALRAYVQAALAADPVRTDWRRLEEYNALDPARVRVPTLLLQGELDPSLEPDALARFFSRLGNPDRQWIVIAGGDHAALLEDMQPAFVAAMTGFIERPHWSP